MVVLLPESAANAEVCPLHSAGVDAVVLAWIVSRYLFYERGVFPGFETFPTTMDLSNDPHWHVFEGVAVRGLPPEVTYGAIDTLISAYTGKVAALCSRVSDTGRALEAATHRYVTRLNALSGGQPAFAATYHGDRELSECARALLDLLVICSAGLHPWGQS